MNSFRRLLTYLANYRGLVAVAILCNVLTAVFTVVSIPIFQPFFNLLFEQTEAVTVAPERIGSFEDLERYGAYRVTGWIESLGRETALLYVCGFILASFLLKNLFRYLALFFMAPVRNGIIRDLRNELYGHLLRLPLGYFTEERKGNLLSRITSDVQEVESSILNVLEAIFREPFIIIGALAFMIVVSPSLTLFVFGLMVFTGVVIGGIGKRLKRSSGEVQETLGDIVSRTEESLGGLRIIKSFGGERYQAGRFAELNDTYKQRLTRLLWRRDLSSPLTEFLGIATVAVLLLYGSRQVFAGTMEAGTFIAFIFAFYMVIDPAKNFSKAWYNVQKGLGALERVEQVLAVTPEVAEGGGAAGAMPSGEADGPRGIAFHHVDFAYGGSDAKVLHDIDLRLPRGKVVALVGGSGGGKSTIADLLPRFYDPTAGAITLDGRDLRDYALTALRDKFGIVSQEAILFNDSIYDNIVFGMQGVSPEQVEAAARVANAHDFIVASPDGYRTNIGDRGSKLSGGQRQRITIARAVLRDPEILILDEATSALDSESERLVQEALQRLLTGRTALVIAHRLSTIQHADEILVLERGRIIERGTHVELLDAGGAYRKLVELQEV